MGFSITWFAVPEAHAESFLSRLSLVASGEVEELPDSLISSAAMNTGWRVLWYNDYECPFLRLETVREISRTHEVLICTVEEHVMDSAASLWRDGERLWHLHHDGSGGAKGLEVDGQTPECFAATRDAMYAEQEKAGGDKADVDMLFEIPLRVAQSISGFKHDEESPHVIGNQFHALKRVNAPADTPNTPSPAKPGFLRRLFGG